MKKLMKVWIKEDPKEVVVYWKKINEQYVSAIKGQDGFNKIDNNTNMVELKANTTRLLRSVGHSDAKLVWKRA